jgi:ribosome-associated protein
LTRTNATSHGGEGMPASRDVAVTPARAAAAKQASDVVVLDVSKVIVITDYFVICTVGNPRQMRTVIDAVEEAVRGLGARPIRREGEEGSGWWLLDYFDVVIHVFGTEERDYYDLERLWRDAPPVDWEASEAVSSG